MQRSRLETAKHCLATAEQDDAAALRSADDMPNVACFHAQQAAEKAVQAALVARCGDSARDRSASHSLPFVAFAKTFCATRRPCQHKTMRAIVHAAK